MLKDIQCPNCDNITQFARICQCCGCSLPGDFTPNPTAYPDNMTIASETNIDPRIERQLTRCRNRVYRPASGSMKEGEIPVVMAVRTRRRLPGFIREIIRIPPTENEKPYDLVTARMSLKDINKLDKSYIVEYPAIVRDSSKDKDADTTSALEENILEEIGLKPLPGVKGSVKVVVGIIDFGMDFAHRHFIKNGKTRIRALWDQSGTSSNANSSKVKYGTLYIADDINRALLTDDPYGTLGYEPPVDSLYETGAHGTYVADIAAGNGFGGQAKGIAPDTDIIFVDLARTAEHNFVGSRYGDSAHLLEAVDFIIREAGESPCVINISLGSNDGPHDGDTLVERGIDRLIARKKKCAVVIAAGNTRDRRLHAQGEIKGGEKIDLNWYIPPYDMTSNEIELWYPSEAELSVQILDPDNAPLCDPIKGDNSIEIPLEAGGSMLIFNRKFDPVSAIFNEKEKKGTVYVYYERREGYLKKGRWKLRLRNEGKPTHIIDFDAWIERDDRGQSVFVEISDKDYNVSDDNTLNSIANGTNTIVVGSSKKYQEGKMVSKYSSILKNRDYPVLHAPGECVLAARSRTTMLRYVQTGTSMAAAVVTGVIALMFAKNPKASYNHIRQTLIDTSKQKLSAAEKEMPVTIERYLDPEEAIRQV